MPVNLHDPLPHQNFEPKKVHTCQRHAARRLRDSTGAKPADSERAAGARKLTARGSAGRRTLPTAATADRLPKADLGDAERRKQGKQTPAQEETQHAPGQE